MDIKKLTGRDAKHLVQLCLPLSHVKGELHYPLFMSEKLDGVYCLAIILDNKCTIYSRTGEVYTSLEHLHAPLMMLSDACNVQVLIFEAYTRGIPQPTISGACRDKHKQHPEIHAYVHDGMSLEDFCAHQSKVPFVRRYQLLLQGFTNIDDHYDSPLYFVFQQNVTCREDIDNYYKFIIARGGEGVILRDKYAYYQPGKRNKTMIKLKQGVSFDLRVVKVVLGTGKYASKMGSLICEDAKGTRVNVGTGFSDKEREEYFNKSWYIVGKIVQIDAMAVSTGGVLREPRFCGIRRDKQEVDTIA